MTYSNRIYCLKDAVLYIMTLKISSGKLHGDENINNVILILKIIKIVSIY